MDDPRVAPRDESGHREDTRVDIALSRGNQVPQIVASTNRGPCRPAMLPRPRNASASVAHRSHRAKRRRNAAFSSRLVVVQRDTRTTRREPALGTVLAVQQPTFDMSVLRAALDPSRAGHEDAVRLRRLAGDGVLEVGVPPQGSRADFCGDMATPLAQRVLALLAVPVWSSFDSSPCPRTLRTPGPNLFPEQPVEGFAEAWTEIDADWNGPGHKPGGQDRWYVESHFARGRDVLVTDDQGMRTMCQRLRDEHGFDIAAESLADYAVRFRE
jgi:hypothetical protein